MNSPHGVRCRGHREDLPDSLDPAAKEAEGVRTGDQNRKQSGRSAHDGREQALDSHASKAAPGGSVYFKTRETY